MRAACHRLLLGWPELLTRYRAAEEQNALRLEYRQAVVGNLKGQLDRTVIIRPDGSSYRPAEEKKKAADKEKS